MQQRKLKATVLWKCSVSARQALRRFLSSRHVLNAFESRDSMLHVRLILPKYAASHWHILTPVLLQFYKLEMVGYRYFSENHG